MSLGLGLSGYLVFAVYMSLWAIFALSIFYKIEIGIYYMAFFWPLQNVMDRVIVYPGGKNFVDIILLGLSISTVLKLNRNKLSILRDRTNIIIVFLVIYSFLSAMFLSGFDMFRVWKNYAVLLLFYFIVIINIEKEEDFKRILYATFASLLVAGLYFYNNYWVPQNFAEESRGIGTFSYLGPDEAAVFCAWYLPVLLSCSIYVARISLKVVFFAIFGLISYTLAYTYSRTGYILAVFSFVVFSLYRSRKLLILPILLFLFWNTVLPKSIVERVEMTFDRTRSDTISQRENMIDIGLSIFSDSPVWGHGFGSVGSLQIEDGIVNHVRKSLHNGAIQLLVEMGVVGLLVYIAIYMEAIRLGYLLARNSGDSLFRGFGVGFAVCSLTALVALFMANVWVYINVNGFFWTYLALSEKYVYLHSNNSPAKDAN